MCCFAITEAGEQVRLERGDPLFVVGQRLPALPGGNDSAGVPIAWRGHAFDESGASKQIQKVGQHRRVDAEMYSEGDLVRWLSVHDC